MGVIATIDITEGHRLVVRDGEKEDYGFVFSSWMMVARELRDTRLEVFNQFYEHKVVRPLLETERVVVLSDAESDTLHGWACARGSNLLHFAYVADKLRGNGFGRSVVSAALRGYPKTVYVTSSPLSRPHHPRFIYNPFLRPQ